jgi:hypothetical protein
MSQRKPDSTNTPQVPTNLGVRVAKQIQTLPNTAGAAPVTVTSSQKVISREGSTVARVTANAPIRYVVNVRTADSRDSIRKANEILAGEVKTSKGSTSTK